MFPLQGTTAGAMLVLAPLLLLLGASPCAASDPVRTEIKKASEKLRDFFAGRRIKEVAVGDVTNADDKPSSSSGPGIRAILMQELERADLKVNPKASVSLSVTFRGKKVPLKSDRKIDQLVVELSFTATFSIDNSKEDILTYRVSNHEAILQIQGITVQPDPKPNAREQQILLAFNKPTANFDGTVVLAGKESAYGVEILVDGQPVRPADDGFGFVKIQRDQTYAIRLVNRSSIEVGVRLSVDGINIFTFSELKYENGPYKGAPLYDMVLIPPKESITILGWHRNNKTSDKFKITEYAGTAAARMNKEADIGTITATFCAAWEKTPPADEPDVARAPGDDGTGFGESTTQKYTTVQRTIGAVRASVAVRYRVPALTK